MKKVILFPVLFFLLLLGCLSSCTTEESATDVMEQSDSIDDTSSGDNSDGNDSGDSGNDHSGDGAGEDTSGNSSDNCEPQDLVFIENEGYILVEMERNAYSEAWEVSTNEPDYTGDGYIVWTGPQYLGSPGNGLTKFKIKINNPGTYEFAWNSSVTIGTSGTDHNDSWLRFPDADDFFAQNGSSIVYPHGSGNTPNPAGSGSDGWFKVYRGGSDLSFKWQALTFDNNGHRIYVTFNSAGEYTMEVSARSSGHAIDKFVLFQDSYSLSEVTSGSFADSGTACGN